MPPRHAKSSRFLESKLFDGLDDFAELEVRITAYRLADQERDGAVEARAGKQLGSHLNNTVELRMVLS